MKIECPERFLLGLAVAGLLAGCSSMMESPDGWAQAPMPGVESVAGEAQAEKKNLAEESVESAEAKVEKPAPPVVEKPAAPVVEEPVATKVEKPAEPKVEQAAAPKVEKPIAPVSWKKGEYPTATPVRSWQGFVYSPYNSRWVNVKDVPSGSLVADPRFPIEEKKYFVVP